MGYLYLLQDNTGVKQTGYSGQCGSNMPTNYNLHVLMDHSVDGGIRTLRKSAHALVDKSKSGKQTELSGVKKLRKYLSGVWIAGCG